MIRRVRLLCSCPFWRIDGVEKMSKSLGNSIGINEEPNLMFEKVMAIPDNLIIRYFELCTDLHPDEVDQYGKQLERRRNRGTSKPALPMKS